MVDLPLISVIVPVYNTEKYLRQCLDSICRQTYSNLEILCVNDGSTDSSCSILQEYAAKDKRIRVFTQENVGQAAARNLALSKATGEWVTGVDSDDFLDSDTFESACSHISDAVDVIYFGSKPEWDGIQPDLIAESFYSPRGIVGAHSMNSDILLNMPWEFCSKLWRRRLLTRENAYFPKGLRFEDWFFFFAYTPAAKGVYFMNTQKYHYVRRANSTMSQSYDRSPRNMEHLQVLELLLQHRQQQPLPFDIARVNLRNFIQTYQFVKDFAPEELQGKVLSESRRIAELYGLFTRWPQRLCFLLPQNNWKKIFATHRLGKSQYGIGPIKLLTVQYRDGFKTMRFLGIKFSKSSY